LIPIRVTHWFWKDKNSDNMEKGKWVKGKYLRQSQMKHPEIEKKEAVVAIRAEDVIGKRVDLKNREVVRRV